MICKVQVEISLVSALCILETPFLSKASSKILSTVNDLVRISVKNIIQIWELYLIKTIFMYHEREFIH